MILTDHYEMRKRTGIIKKVLVKELSFFNLLGNFLLCIYLHILGDIKLCIFIILSKIKVFLS